MSCVEAAGGGRAQVVWIEGDAGSGKTAVVRRVLDCLPPEFSVLRVEADELSRDVALGVVSQFGSVVAGTGFAAGVELLALFAAAQDDGPAAVVIEDVHWADVASRPGAAHRGPAFGKRPGGDVVDQPSRCWVADGWDRFCLDPDRCARVVLGALSSAEVLELAKGMGVGLTAKEAARLHHHTGATRVCAHLVERTDARALDGR